MSIESVLKKLYKKYDDGQIIDLRKQQAARPIERVPVPSPKIGDLLGAGGYPRGRLIEIFGAESGGKTTLCSYFAGVCQKHDFEFTDSKGKTSSRKGMVVFIDAEHSYDLDYAKIHGFDLSRSILVQPDNGEQALDIAINFIESGEVDMVIIDSIAALTPLAEIEADMDQMQMGLQARMISKFLRKSVALTAQTKTTLICVNQIRDRIGTYGGGWTTPGGHALKFFSSIRLEVRRKEYINNKGVTTGIMIAAKTVKNKTAPPMRSQLLELDFKKGFDSHLEWVEFAIDLGIIESPAQGSFILLNGDRIRGRANVVEFYSNPENAEEYQQVIEKTKEIMYTPNKPVRVSVESEEDRKEMEELLEEDLTDLE